MTQIISMVLVVIQISFIGIFGFRSIKEYENKNYEDAIYSLLWMIVAIVVLKK